MVQQLAREPSTRLLKHVVRCYLRLSDNLRYVVRVCNYIVYNTDIVVDIICMLHWCDLVKGFCSVVDNL